MKYCFFGASGRVASAHNDATVKTLPPGAHALTELQWDSRLDLVLADGVITVSAQPSAHYEFSEGAWRADIDAMRAAKLRELDVARDAAIAGGFEFDGTMFDSDAKSIQRISGAVTLSMLDPAYVTEWISFDNSTVTLDAAGLAGLGVAAGQHEASQIFKARGLKNAALAATTVEEIQSITW
jgi:hypothetical protein